LHLFIIPASALRPPKDAKQCKMMNNIDKPKMRVAIALTRVDKYCKRLEKTFCQAHNPEVEGSNPSPATNHRMKHRKRLRCFFLLLMSH